MIGTLNDLILAVIIAGAVAYTVFSPAYLWWSFGVWNHTLVGWALATAAASMALVLDLTLLFRVWTPPGLVGLWVSLVVLGLVAVGGWLKLAALAVEVWRHYHRADR